MRLINIRFAVAQWTFLLSQSINFKGKNRKPLFFALAFHNGLEYCINSSGDSFTSDINLVRFVPVTSKFTRLNCVQ